MAFLDRVPYPRRLRARVWLLTVPSAILSFERRQRLPRLPLGRLRLLGSLLFAGGAVVALRGLPASNDGPAAFRSARSFGLARFLERPPVLGGLLALTGVGVLLRSLLLTAYALGLALAFARQAVDLEEPRLPGRQTTSAWDPEESDA